MPNPNPADWHACVESRLARLTLTLTCRLARLCFIVVVEETGLCCCDICLTGALSDARRKYVSNSSSSSIVVYSSPRTVSSSSSAACFYTLMQCRWIHSAAVITANCRYVSLSIARSSYIGPQARAVVYAVADSTRAPVDISRLSCHYQ